MKYLFKLFELFVTGKYIETFAKMQITSEKKNISQLFILFLSNRVLFQHPGQLQWNKTHSNSASVLFYIPTLLHAHAHGVLFGINQVNVLNILTMTQ